jgi:hypothetical protein
MLSSLSAQYDKGYCGTKDMEVIKERLLKNKSDFEKGIGLSGNRAVSYVPIQFNLLARDDGSQRAKVISVLSQLNALNTDYTSLELVYYLNKNDLFHPINNTGAYEDPANYNWLLSNHRNSSALNVFIAKNANNPGALGTVLGYYSSERDWVVMRSDQLGSASGTLSHELGHFFSLLHTFNGWDREPWDEASHGNPVTMNWAPSDNVRVELVARTNCDDAGDFLCDTPADYNLGFGWNVGGDQCAPYTGGCLDANSDELDPDEENFMGYFIDCEEYHFSNDQKDMILTDYNSSARNYIRSSYVPNSTLITDSVEAVFPPHNGNSTYFDQVDFEWSPVAGADYYYFELSLTSSFGNSIFSVVTEDLTETVQGLIPNFNYYWRVIAFNETNAQMDYQIFKFKNSTVSGTKELYTFKNIQLSPNPINRGEKMMLNISSEKKQEFLFNVYDISGRLISDEWLEINPGVNQSSVDVSMLESGLYFARISDGNKLKSIKFLVN